MPVWKVDDSFTALKKMPVNLFDVTITDPPFTKHVQENLCSGSLVGTKAVPKYDLPFDPLADYAFVGDLLRATKRWVVVFCAVESFGLIQAAYPEEYVRGCIWVKTNAMGQLTKDRPATSYEGIALLHKKETKKRWNGKGSYGVWVCPGTRGEKDRHPNQKPLPLCLKLMALFSERREIIFDPFVGSGRIGEASVGLDRRFVGWERDEAWVEKANRKIGAAPKNWHEEIALKLCAARGLWADTTEGVQD